MSESSRLKRAADRLLDLALRAQAMSENPDLEQGSRQRFVAKAIAYDDAWSIVALELSGAQQEECDEGRTR